MNDSKPMTVDSPLGKQSIDSTGSPVGVVRMDVDKSYGGIGELLRDVIDNSSQDSWDEITARIDYTYSNLDLALAPLEEKTDLKKQIRTRLEKGQKLLFKPNTVSVHNIDARTHGPNPSSTCSTEWSFIAALMRWFHDKLGISYHQMSLGEAATIMPSAANQYTLLNPEGKKITPEATLEGKSGNFYGGWGFYFARRYLSESLAHGAGDDPMNGHKESVDGLYIPPGQVSDKLMVYDLNRIDDDLSKGRKIEVPDGVNYKSIMLHKAVVGGDPADPEDMSKYPGCVLVNVPKFKVHAITLFTNIIKNLGIGLYPMQYSSAGDQKWDYSIPHAATPGMKGGIPHEVWVADVDPETSLPKLDAKGNYIVSKTGGITATMIDIVKAVSNQNIFMIHVVDGIETINCDHMGSLAAVREPEGMVFAGLDPVAADLLCARYMFSNVPLKKALSSGIDDGMGGNFPQEVPVPVVEGNNIVTRTGFDCPLSRDICFQRAEERGLGSRKYYVVGHDTISDSPFASLQGHLGTVKGGIFSDHVTKTLFFDMYKMPWDLQKTAFGYLDALDKLTGTSLKKEFLEAFDEDGDGVLTYEEFGKKGFWGSFLHTAGKAIGSIGTEKLDDLKSGFYMASMLKNSDPLLNSGGNDIFKEFFNGAAIMAAMRISQMEIEAPDPFQPDLTFGGGKWPGIQLAHFFQIGASLFGSGYPNTVAFPSLFGSAFLYADLTQNGGRYAGANYNAPDPDVLERYISGVASSKEKPLDFTFYVPSGYETLSGNSIPNIEVTDDPSIVLTVSFSGGKEIWP